MLKLLPADLDDIDFISLVQRILNGALAALEIGDVFIVHVDSWFDHKWLRWWSRKGEELRVPTFTPNRVVSEKRFVRDSAKSVWTAADMPSPLHIHQPGRPWLAQPLDRFSRRAAFLWYSGNTASNKFGCLMFYVSGSDGYAWYASLKKNEDWSLVGEAQITRRELSVFEERGHQLELAEV
jgi:hypothetical protein